MLPLNAVNVSETGRCLILSREIDQVPALENKKYLNAHSRRDRVLVVNAMLSRKLMQQDNTRLLGLTCLIRTCNSRPLQVI